MNTYDIVSQVFHRHDAGSHRLRLSIGSWARHLSAEQVLNSVVKAGGVAFIAGTAAWIVSGFVEGREAGYTLQSMEHWVKSLPPGVGTYSPVGHPRCHRFIVSLNYTEALHHVRDLPLYAQAQVIGAISAFAGGLTGILAYIGMDFLASPELAIPCLSESEDGEEQAKGAHYNNTTNCR